jgi:hypothetical protein
MMYEAVGGVANRMNRGACLENVTMAEATMVPPDVASKTVPDPQSQGGRTTMKELQSELDATRAQLMRMQEQLAALAERVRPQVPGIPVMSPPLDAEAVVRETIRKIDEQAQLADKLLASGEKQFDVVLLVGSKAQERMRRVVGGGTPGEAQWKWMQYFGVTGTAPPSKIVVTSVGPSAAAA